VSLFEAINPLVSSFKNAFLILHRPLLSVLLEQCLTRIEWTHKSCDSFLNSEPFDERKGLKQTDS